MKIWFESSCICMCDWIYCDRCAQMPAGEKRNGGLLKRMISYTYLMQFNRVMTNHITFRHSLRDIRRRFNSLAKCQMTWIDLRVRNIRFHAVWKNRVSSQKSCDEEIYCFFLIRLWSICLRFSNCLRIIASRAFFLTFSPILCDTYSRNSRKYNTWM